MRGRRASIASVLADVLSARPEARLPAVAAAFAEACGARLAREAALRAVTRDGRLIVVARSAAWARELEALSGTLCDRINGRLRRAVATGIEIRVGPLSTR